MKRIIFGLLFLIVAIVRGATGDVTVTINADGWSANVAVAGFTSGATYTFGYTGAVPGASTPYFTVVSKGFDNTGTATTITRTVYVTTNVDVPYSTATIPGTFTSGTFVDGETVTEAVTLATAVVVGVQASGPFLRVRTVAGTPTTAHAWTGGTSGAIFAQVGSISTLTLPVHDELSPSAGLVTRVALSDYIYVKDNTGAGNSGTAPTFTAPASFIVNAGGSSQPSNIATAIAVTQSSTQAYPAVIMRTLTLPYKLIGSGSFTTEVQAFHRHAMNGKPVACVKCSYTDGTISPRVQTATAMSLSTDADQLPVYAFPDTGSNFTQSANIVGNYIAYPWVGDTALDSSANAWQNTGMKLSNLPVGVCDKGGTYGVTYCAVDTSTGSDSNTTAYTTQAAAEAGLKTLTMGKAMNNIQVYNGANYSRTTVDAGVVVLMGGGNLYGVGLSSVAAISACACTITRASSITRAQAIITGFNADSRYGPAITRLYDLSVVSSSGSNQLIGFVKNQSPVIVEDTTITGSDSNTNLFSSDTNGKAAGAYKNVTMSHYVSGMNSGNDNGALLVRNCTVSFVDSKKAFTGARAVVGTTLIDNNANAIFSSVGAPAGWTESGNVIYSYNKALSHSDSFFDNLSLDMTDWAFVCNMDERIGAAGSPSFEISGAIITNVLLWHNTIAGQRANTEGDIVTAPFVDHAYTLSSFRYNSWYYNGTHNPGDVHCADGSITGQWPYSQYCVGWAGNNGEITPDASVYSFGGIKSTVATVAGYTSDRSIQGTNAGNGNYVPTASSILIGKVRSTLSVIPYDLARRAIPNDGTGAAGAYQPPAVGGVGFWW